MVCLIRNAMNADVPTVSRIIISSLRESNARNYSSEIINK